MPIRILMFGDVVGRIGRQAVKKILPKLKKKYKVDLTILNAENLAHGLGITAKVLEELLETGVDIFTSGNHIWDKKDAFTIFSDNKFKEKILRPANYPPQTPGRGFQTISVNARQILIINLMGRVFFPENFDCPFRKLDEILRQHQDKNLDGIIVDFHAEATSEKKALSYYGDGRVSAVLGTHTHTPTADWQILPQGTAHVSDIGMTGAKDSVIGVQKELVLKNFLSQIKQTYEIPKAGICSVNAIFLEINPKTKLAEKIEKIYKEVEL